MKHVVCALAALLAGCSPSRTASKAPLTPAPAAKAATLETSEPLRLQLFAELEAKVREVHVFSPNTEKNLGFTWQDEVPQLREEFRRASSRPALQEALFHFDASLHDTHCRYRPEGNDARLRLPLRLEAFANGDAAELRVTSVRTKAAAKGIAVGDVLASFDGVVARDLVHTHRNVSNMNQWPLVAEEVARYLTRRRLSNTTLRAGARSTLALVGADGAAKQVTLDWEESGAQGDSDFSADYADKSCGPETPEYGHGYQIAARGHGACVYASKDPGFAGYPIVYQWTFRYWNDEAVGQYVLADQALLQSTLARLAPRGVVLDVSHNGGGNNPNLFLDWWAPHPYVDMYTRVRLIPALHTEAQVDQVLRNMGGATTRSYLAELLTHAQGAKFTKARPFACPEAGCDWDNRYTPSHRVTTAPVALVVGGGCNSACAAFVLQFERARWAPLVGTSSMAGYTTHRYKHELPEGLGSLDFASSEDAASADGPSVEGLPTQLTDTISQTWANRGEYASLLVERAIAALRRSR